MDEDVLLNEWHTHSAHCYWDLNVCGWVCREPHHETTALPGRAAIADSGLHSDRGGPELLLASSRQKVSSPTW
jgi:hypothetical protein